MISTALGLKGKKYGTLELRTVTKGPFTYFVIKFFGLFHPPPPLCNQPLSILLTLSSYIMAIYTIIGQEGGFVTEN